MNQEIKNSITPEEQTEHILKQLHHEINFASKVLGTKTSEFNNTLQGSIAELNSLLAKFDNIIVQTKDQNTAITEELTTFALLPEKITNGINSIVLQIATQVENIHKPSVLEVKDQFTSLKQELAKEAANYQYKLEDVTNRFIVNATTTSKNSRRQFLINLGIMILFSALVSGSTSYLIATQFPRYVEVKGVNGLTIHNSKVEVWGAKVPDTTEQDSKKK